MSCDAPPDAFLDARLTGGFAATVHWDAAAMDCRGMPRPDGAGLRVSFQGTAGGEPLTLVFGLAALAEGAGGRAVPVNVTLIRGGGRLYGTRGDDKCVLDEVRQTRIDAPTGNPTARRWSIEARGFCLEPARTVTGDPDAILPARFDFRGQVTWEPEPPAPAPPPSRPPPLIAAPTLEPAPKL